MGTQGTYLIISRSHDYNYYNVCIGCIIQYAHVLMCSWNVNCVKKKTGNCVGFLRSSNIMPISTQRAGPPLKSRHVVLSLFEVQHGLYRTVYTCSQRSLLLSNIVCLIYSEQQEVGGGHMLVPYLFTITQALSESSCLSCMR